MQPTQYPINFHELYASWRRFVEQGALDPQIDPLVAMSWRRCLRKHNPYTDGVLPRLSEDALQGLRVRQFDLIAIARPFMEDIYQCVEQSGHLVALLDATGCILDVLGAAGINVERGRPGETMDVPAGIYVVSPAGELLGRIPILEDTVTNLAFGPPDRKTLYVTAGRNLYKMPIEVSGHAL